MTKITITFDENLFREGALASTLYQLKSLLDISFGDNYKIIVEKEKKIRRKNK